MKNLNFIKEIMESNYFYYFKKYFLNRYMVLAVLFLVWMLFIDESNFFLQKELNTQISKLELQKDYFNKEYAKNDSLYKKLNNNKLEREKYARENYFMKKQNEDIFILVVDSSNVKN